MKEVLIKKRNARPKKNLNISIMGLGYVGSVCAASFSANGHRVMGVDIDSSKVKSISLGKSPIVEPGLADLIKNSVEKGFLKVTTQPNEGLKNANVILVCVGTPSQTNGNLDYSIIERTCEDIGLFLRYSNEKPVIVIRSTILPGFIQDVAIPALEKNSGKKQCDDFFVCVNPEFLREGTAIKDFYDPSCILVGASEKSMGTVTPMIRKLYSGIKAKYVFSSIEVAEAIKYAGNAFHAVKISFANEIGRLCQLIGADSHEVMNVLCLDKKLNISPAYLKPGFAFGGSCLPKDLRAMNYFSKTHDISTPFLNSILDSNEQHIFSAFQAINLMGKKKVTLLGLSFKPDTDDLRESPLVKLAEDLIGKGKSIKIYDPILNIKKLRGANLQYIKNQIPHIARLLTDSIKDALKSSDIVIIGTSKVNWKAVKRNLQKNQIIFDLGKYVPSELKKCNYYSLV